MEQSACRKYDEHRLVAYQNPKVRHPKKKTIEGIKIRVKNLLKNMAAIDETEIV